MRTQMVKGFWRKSKHGFLTALAVMLMTVAGHAAEATDSLINHTIAKQAIIVDFDTGMTLFEKNADERMPTSSMSKTITLYMIFEALRDGRLSLDTELPVSEKAWKKGGSKMFLEVGTRVSVDNLIQGVAVQSGNDAAITLAEGLAGDEDTFAKAANARAKELGMENTHFMNATGWPDPNHYSTARDLSILAHHLIGDFPEYFHYFKETEFTWNNIRQRNRNPLLYRDIGADGLKTGHTEVGGYGLIGTGERDGRRVIVVVNGLPSEKARAQEGARLLEWGLKGFDNMNLFAKGETVDYVPVVMGKKGQVPLVVDKDVKISIPRNFKNDLKVEVVFNGPLEAPVEAGQEVGTLRVSVPHLSSFDVPLYAGEKVGRLGLIAGTIEKARILLGHDVMKTTE